MIQKKTTKKLWHFPWHFNESIIIASGLIVIGFLLELATGNKQVSPPPFPLNAVILSLFIIYKLITYKLFKGPIICWFASKYAAVASITAFTFLIVLMGFIPQSAEKNSFIGKLGLTHIKTSWPYLFSVVLLLTSLGYTIIHRLFNLKMSIRKIAFLLNHIGLFIMITGGTLGSSDLYRFKMFIHEGKMVDYAYLDQSAIKMPFTIKLHDFKIEEYPPTFVLINPETNAIVMDKEEGNWKIAKNNTEGWVDKSDAWYIKVLDYHEYGNLVDTSYINDNKFGATHAAHVSLCNKAQGLETSGWVSCGNFWNPSKILHLHKNLALAMTTPKPKSYYSTIDFYLDGECIVKNQRISVNHPFSYKGWKFYQSGYNSKHGRWSELSILDVVRDPWLPYVYIGIFMVLLGSIYLLFDKKTITK